MNINELGQLSENEARELLEKVLWGENPVCPFCGNTHAYALHGETTRNGLYECASCGKPFTVTVNTIMHRSHLPIKTWLMAFYFVCSSKKGVSALQLQKMLGLGSYRTAWLLVHKIRKAMEESPDFCKFFCDIEVDETYVGGKDIGHNRRGRNTAKKTPVVGMVERTSGKVKIKPVKRVDAKTLHKFVLENAEKFSTIITDEWQGYAGIGKHFDGGHHKVNHSKKEFVNGSLSTNWIESFWSLLKKGVGGIFHHVSVKHLGLYCDEFSFRWNNRKQDNWFIFQAALKGIAGKRLEYATLVK